MYRSDKSATTHSPSNNVKIWNTRLKNFLAKVCLWPATIRLQCLLKRFTFRVNCTCSQISSSSVKLRKWLVSGRKNPTSTLALISSLSLPTKRISSTLKTFSCFVEFIIAFCFFSPTRVPDCKFINFCRSWSMNRNSTRFKSDNASK